MLNIIYFADQWDIKWRRRQQIALRLSQRPEIRRLYYVELPLSLTSFVKYIFGLADFEAKARWNRVKRCGFVFKHDKVTIITPITLLPYFTTCAFSIYNLALVKKSFTRYLPKGFRPDIVWTSLPFDGLWLKYYTDYKLVYDCSEKFTDFIQWQYILPSVKHYDEILTINANIIFVQTSLMLKEKGALNGNTYLVENACDIDKFIAPVAIPVKMSNIKRPIIGYSGSINSRIDFELIEQLAEIRSDWNFVFVGPYHEIPLNKSNIYFLGEVAYNDLSAYINNFDVCIMPHKTEGVSQSQSPLKLFDYLASGKPIVTSDIQGIKGYENILYIGADALGFISAIEKALADGNKNKKKRIEMVASCSWDKRVGYIWDLLEKYVM